MNLIECREGLLKELHAAIRKALKEDDCLTAEGKEAKFYARTFPDWQKFANELESVMTEKGISFTPIKW